MKLLMTLFFVAACAQAAVPEDHAARMNLGLDLFKTDIAPVLKENCVDCHGGAKTKADLDLATREGLLLGGAEGAVVVPFSSAGSRLMKLIRHEEKPSMPEKKPKLPEEVIAKIARWIDLGAPYDSALVAGKAAPRDRSKVSDADRQWWAFQPLMKVAPPAGFSHPVDAFLLKAAQEKHLTLNPPAEARRLVRRASLALTGLPPSPEMAASFAAAPSPAAWGKCLDDLLASPAYGERWARHWLDVARFAESSGFEHDYDRPFAFHYRDFVIRALNADMPFDQFTRWQLAGDEFAPDNPEAMMATGFLGAGVFPTQITANEVERTRYDAMDDMLSTTSSAFLGLTVGCARCHDHKFDPIPTADYYRLLSTFTTTVRSNVRLVLDPAGQAKAEAAHAAEQAKLAAELQQVEGSLILAFKEWRQAPAEDPPSWTVLDLDQISSQGGASFRNLEDGSWLAEGNNPDTDTYTVTAHTNQQHLSGLKLDALTHDSLTARGPGRAGNGNFALGRIRITAAPTAGGAAVEVKIASAEATHEQNKDGLSVASALDENAQSGWAVDAGGIGKDQSAAFRFAEPTGFPGGTRLTVTMEFAVNTRHTIARPRFSVCSNGVPELKGAAIPEALTKLIQRKDSLNESEQESLFQWWKQNQPAWKASRDKMLVHEKQKPDVSQPVMVCAEGYDPIVMHSQGPPFLPETHLLKRGDTNQKQEVARPGFLQVLSRSPQADQWQWTPPAGAPYSGRRRSLANWMTDVEKGGGALMARVAVNRLWQHHFGRGLVATPNDFGKTGTLPANPALLDWLAGELIRHGWQLKPLHRLIMTSAAYQQNTIADPAKTAADPDNNLFLRRIPRRLEAEAVRDSTLAVAGLLDPTMYGPGSLDENSHRRSIYFTVKRSQLVNSMVVFDAPEPLVSQGSRPTTTVAPQALLMMNSPQSRTWAQAFAHRILRLEQPADPAAQVNRAYQLALGREPRPAELSAATAFIASGTASYQSAGQPDPPAQALADFCQMVCALNEFVYAD
jgi:mono/diheme cytochrome c family protein